MEEEIEKQADEESKSATDKETEEGSDQNSNKIKIVMCPSRKMLKMKLTLLKTKKIGSNTSEEAPKKLKNIWKNRRYHAGLKHTED